MGDHFDEPTAADLAAIETEQPLIDAEMAWLDAEISMLTADERGGTSEMDRQRLRRTESRVIRETLAYVARRHARSTDPRRAA
ncbi:DUF6284 family protein [Actinoplanes sp. CA-131856]